MKPPIVIVSDDVTLYSSVDNAERSLEAIDVEAGGIQVFDSLGRRLRAVVKKRKWLSDVVKIEDDIEGHRDEAAVRAAVIRIIASVERSDGAELESLTTEALIERGLKYRIR